MTPIDVSINVNGVERQATVEPRTTLADVLRERFGLTGTHLGCEHGVCGACTVLVDGDAVRSCLMLGVQAHGSRITTIEGLADGDVLHPLQEAFRENLSFQCGFCTPGFVMSTLALLEEGRLVDEATLREELSGNICRCTGYESILEGVRRAVEQLGEPR